jgi:Domain of unknown function (DUF4878)
LRHHLQLTVIFYFQMRYRLLPLLLSFALLMQGCGSNKEIPGTDLDVAKAFITGVQQNKFDDAAKLMLKDDANREALQNMEKAAARLSKDELEGYKLADIIVNEIENVSDSVTVIHYSSSYKRENKKALKLVKQNGRWLVDLKYTFSGNM